jgi:alkylated DNA repair protein (DNA oxidative demethylase)
MDMTPPPEAQLQIVAPDDRAVRMVSAPVANCLPAECVRKREMIGAAAFVLRRFAEPYVNELLRAIHALKRCSPFRQMVTPGGFVMSVAMTNCGQLGWITDRKGYRYTEIDPETGLRWPLMPAAFNRLARDAAAVAGFANFAPDACLINRYVPGNRLTLHQDKNERDFNAPIVSVSLGLPAVFLFGGHERKEEAARIPLMHGDVTVWGGEDRLRYHGVMPLGKRMHTLVGYQRINLTFRKAG